MRRRGFTLIEVLIVVIILGILATLAIPQFANMTRRARLAEAWAGMGGIRTAQAVYKMEHDEYADCILDTDFVAPTGSKFTYAMQDATATAYNINATGSHASTMTPTMNAWLHSNGTSDYEI